MGALQKVNMVKLSRSLASYTGWQSNEMQAFKKLICPSYEARDPDVANLILVSTKTGLCPFRRQIYLVYRQGKPSIQVGIDGFYKIAHESGEFAGFAGTMWAGPDGKWQDFWDSEKLGHPTYCKAGARRKGHPEPSWATVRFSSYYPKDPKCQFMWNKMPERMIEKCAEALILRKLFQQLSHLYTDEEMMQAGPPDDVTVKVEDSPPPAGSSQTNSRESQRSTRGNQGQRYQPQPSKPKKGESAEDHKKRRVAYLMRIVSRKWPDLKGDERNAALRRFADAHELLTTVHEDDGTSRGSIRASSVLQVDRLIYKLTTWDPKKEPDPTPEPDDAQEAEYEASVTIDQLARVIEHLERDLSGVSPLGREAWYLDQRRAALADVAQDWPNIPAGQVYGPWLKEGPPDAPKWSKEQIKRWLIRLEKVAASEVPL